MTAASLPVLACVSMLISAASAPAQTAEPSSAAPAQPEASSPTPTPPPSPTPAPSHTAENDATEKPETPALSASAASDLRIAFSPYIWLTGFSGDVGIRNIDINLNKNFFEIYDESDSVFGLMGALDLSYKRFVFQYQGSWVTADFSEEVGTVDTGTVEAKLDLEAAWNEVFTGIRVIERPLGEDADKHGSAALDVFCGGRFSTVSVDATLTATSQIVLPDGGVITPGASVGRDRSENWFEPFIGARAVFELDEHWVIQLRGDVGGFGVDGSDFSWQAIGVIGYQWRNDGWDIGLFAGYRALGQDYSNDDFRWDMITHGPAIGGSIRLYF